MAAEEMSLLPTSNAPAATTHHRHHNGGAINPPPPHQLLFHDNTGSVHRFPPFQRHSGDPGPKTTREFTAGFIDDSRRFYQPQHGPEFRHAIYATPIHTWNVNGRPSDSHGSDGDEDEDDDDNDREDDDDELNEGDGEVIVNDNNNSSSNYVNLNKLCLGLRI